MRPLLQPVYTSTSVTLFCASQPCSLQLVCRAGIDCSKGSPYHLEETSSGARTCSLAAKLRCVLAGSGYGAAGPHRGACGHTRQRSAAAHCGPHVGLLRPHAPLLQVRGDTDARGGRRPFLPPQPPGGSGIEAHLSVSPPINTPSCCPRYQKEGGSGSEMRMVNAVHCSHHGLWVCEVAAATYDCTNSFL